MAKVVFLSLALLTTIVISGVGIYAADVATGHATAIDGYGISAIRH